MQKISTGIEPLKNSIRIWWKINGNRERETLQLPPTPQNLEHAKQIADMIKMQLTLGTFDHAKTFPHSKKRPENYYGYYIQQYKEMNSLTVAPSTWTTYISKIENHITPYWQHKKIYAITTDDFEYWVYKNLLPNLSPKTIKDIIMLWQSIWQRWARTQTNPKDPTKFIKLTNNDSEDIDPFTKEEIEIIINTETDPTLKNLWTVMLWSGLSTHELLPLATSDLDLANKYLYVNRGYVNNIHKATKNRRRKRQIQLLPKVIEALQNQTNIIKNNQVETIKILGRDNNSYQTQNLQWLWYNSETKTHFNYHKLKNMWIAHLDKCKIRYRPPNNGRHTYASQVLSTGAVSAEWLANQLGHTSTDMIHKHYGKFIPKDAIHIINRLSQLL